METSVDKEQEMILKVDKKIKDGIDVMYQNFDNIENNILDLMKVCPCVFDKDMMVSLLLDFQLLDKQMGNFESMATQLDDPVNMAQAIVMDTMMRKLSQLMDRLVGYITKCNSMIEAHQFDAGKALLLEKLENHFEYDAVDYDDLEHAFDNPYLVCHISDVLDKDYDQNYYPLHTLRIESFKDKVSAYKYMLEHGISKDNLILRY